MSTEFLITALVVCLMPGAGVLYTLAVALGRGFRASVIAAFGCTLGIVPSVIASVAGLAALLHASATAFQVLKFLGVAYLLYMGWMMLREGGALAIGEKREPASARKLIRDAVLLNALNPKLSLFFLAFLPQFVPAHAARPTLLMLFFAGVFMAMTLVVFVVYGASASLARTYVVSKPAAMAWLRRSFAATFGLLGLRLALSER